jgi:hypothetical protein
MNMEQVQENMRAVKILGPIGENRPVKKKNFLKPMRSHRL